MMKYRYKIKPLAQRKIRSFYYNVAKKYRHTYSKWLMHRNIDPDREWPFEAQTYDSKVERLPHGQHRQVVLRLHY